MKLTVAIFDADDNEVERHEHELEPVSDAVIQDMISMVEKGTPAWLASYLATHPVVEGCA